jgi:hypothetical protein
VKCTEKKWKAASKWVRDLHHSFSSNEHTFYVRIVNFLLLLLFSHPFVSVFQST